MHPSAEGYRVYFEQLKDELLNDLVDETLTVSKATYEDTVPASLDLDTVDTDRYVGGTANSNSAAGLSTIKNYTLGQVNGFMGGNSISAAKEGYSTTFNFTGKNALIWANKHSHNALYDVYLNDNTDIGNPDYTIDMWRNQDGENDAQNYLFPVLPEDLETAQEVQVTIVLRKNVDTATRTAQLGYNAYDVGTGLRNQFRNIAIKGGTMDSVEFMASPDAFLTTVEYPDIVVPAEKLGLPINPGNSMAFETVEYDGKTVCKATYDGKGGTGQFAADGHHIGNFGAVIGEYYNYATIYMYVDDPDEVTATLSPAILVREADNFEFKNNEYTADAKITPNAWQRISIDISNMELDNPNPMDSVNQYHLRFLGNGTTASSYPNVTVYAEKLVFSAEDPGDWADLNARITKIKVNGEAIDDYNANTTEYTVELPFGTTEVPEVTYETNVAEATVTVKNAADLTDTATVTLEGATDEEDIVYTISFTVFDGIRLNGINAGDTAVELKDGVTEYQVNLPTGTTEVPEIVADYEGDPAKIAVTQAESLDGAATIVLTNGEDVTTYTVTFYVMPSMTELYPDAEIVYVSQSGAGAKDGTSPENAYAGLKTAAEANQGNEQQTVFALVDGVTITSNGAIMVPKNTVITSAGGNLYCTSNPSFNENSKANITIENIDIYHTRADGGDGEIYVVARGNNLVMRNVNAIPYGEKDGVARTAKLFVQPGGDGGNFNNLEAPVSFELYNVTGVTVRGGGYGGTTMNKGINYVIGGESEVDYIQASGHAANPDVKASEKTITGDITVTVKDDAVLNKISAGNASILDGNVYYNIQGGSIDKIFFGAEAGNVTGNVILTITGGTVGETAQGKLNADMARVIVAKKELVPEKVAGNTHLVTYEGDGTVTAAADAAGAVTITLASETAQWAAITTPDGVTKKYDMATDEEVVLAHDMTIAIAEGTTAVVFNAGTGVTFKAYEADGAIADSTNTVTGLEGMSVPTPEAIAPKNEHFEFVGWALEGDETKTIVENFGTFTAENVTYIAIFKEAPSVQFKATFEAGAVEDMDYTIYGITGEEVSPPLVPVARDHFTPKGWAFEGTTEVVDFFGTFTDEKVVYVAVYEEDPKYSVTIVDGEYSSILTDYTGFTYTLEKLEHTTTSRFLGYATTPDATEPTAFAGDEITVTSDVTYYAVRKEIKLEDAEYTFAGEYDYSEKQYVIEMYYEGPKANMTAFGLAYPAELTDISVEYSDTFQTTGTHSSSGEGYYVDVVYPKEGATFGDDMKTPVLVATIKAGMTPEQYASLSPDSFGKYDIDTEITGAYKNGEWQYIKNSEEFSLDIASHVYPIYFTELVDDRDITITATGADEAITTVTAPTLGMMLTEITFMAVTAEGEEPAQVSYYVDGVPMGELTAAEDGFTYTIPAESVLGDVTIEFSYGEPILEVAITDITAPAAQGTPDTEATAGHDTYTIDSVTWEPAGDTFGFDTAYTVKVTVSADDEYAFTGKTVYTIDGNTATVKKIDIDTVELSYTYEPTVKELGTVSVAAGLVRAAADAAYANFGKVSVLDAEGNVVAYADEAAEAGNVFAAELEVLAGTYTVKVEKNGYLTYTETVEVVYNKTTEVETDLVAGNLYEAGVDDDVIDLLDFARVTKAFTSETTETDAEALEAYRALVDIDEDGVVTVYDLAYIKANFGEKAE